MPRNKDDYANIQKQRKSALLDSSLRLFALFGYDSISIDDITKDAKCSHGLFYHYFNSKEDLLLQLISKNKDDWENSAKSIDFTQKPKFVLREIIDFHLSKLNASDKSAYAAFFFLTTYFQKKLPEPLLSKKQKKEHLFPKILELIKRGQEDGDFEKGEPRDYALVLLACLRGLAYARIHLGPKEFTTPKPEVLMNLFIRKDTPYA
ncbi:MAG: TetR/AcrR family transcriptional regulator [Bacilli bacterium]